LIPTHDKLAKHINQVLSACMQEVSNTLVEALLRFTVPSEAKAASATGTASPDMPAAQIVTTAVAEAAVTRQPLTLAAQRGGDPGAPELVPDSLMVAHALPSKTPADLTVVTDVPEVLACAAEQAKASCEPATAAPEPATAAPEPATAAPETATAAPGPATAAAGPATADSRAAVPFPEAAKAASDLATAVQTDIGMPDIPPQLLQLALLKCILHAVKAPRALEYFRQYAFWNCLFWYLNLALRALIPSSSTRHQMIPRNISAASCTCNHILTF